MSAVLKQQSSSFSRVIWIILDGVGAGELPDAKDYGDVGSNTLGNLARAYHAKSGKTLKLPNLAKMGVGNITPIEGVPPTAPGQGLGAYGKAIELSLGKDTTSGHWEMAGLVVKKAFATFPGGFPKEIIDRWCRENSLPGVLGNRSASGTEIIVELGEEHMRTGKPILYTSADSVWQVAAHEESFGLERLQKICKSARKICDELQISRVISRPFIGDPSKGKPFSRTYNRKDFSQNPPAGSYLDALIERGIPTLGIGKISNIYAGKGIQENLDTKGNEDGIRVLIEQVDQRKTGLIYCNLIDFDMLYGHRRDVPGFAKALEDFDKALPEIWSKMSSEDLLLIAADHGNDPTYRGSDHTREYIPVLAYTPRQTQPSPVNLGTRACFGDVGATMLHALTGNESLASQTPWEGKSFLPSLVT